MKLYRISRESQRSKYEKNYLLIVGFIWQTTKLSSQSFSCVLKLWPFIVKKKFYKYLGYGKIFYLYLESSSASRECENSNVVLFADPVVHSVRRHPRVTLKINFSSDSNEKNSKYCKETVK